MRRIAYTLSAAALIAVGLLTVSACGGGSSQQVAQLDGATTTTSDVASTTTSGTATTSQDPRDAILAFTRCMRTEGIDLPDPDFSGGGLQRGGGAGGGLLGTDIDRNSPAFRAAQETCRPLLAAIRQQFSPERRQQFQDAALAFAKCMRGNGIEMADPDFSGQPGQGGGGGLFRGSGVDPSDPKVQEAMAACRHVFTDAGLPNGPGGRGGGGFTGPPPGGGNG